MRWIARLAAAILVPALLQPLVTTASAAVSTGVGVSAHGLIIYYDPANPSAYNGSSLRDLSGNSFDATFYRNGAWPGEETSRGKYLGFDGGGGYLDLANNLSGVSWSSGVSVSFYANFGGGANNFERIIDFGNGAEADNIVVGRHGTSTSIFAEIFESNAGGQCVSDSGAIGNATWDFWTVTFDGSNCKIYKNNSLIKTVANSKKPRSGVIRNNAYIGKSNWADASFEGGISDLAIYNRILNSSEMTQNYNASTDYTAPTVTGGGNSANENQNMATLITSNEFGSTFSIMGGSDGDTLTISSGGYVYFRSNPNYELPTDFGANRRYDFQVRVIDPNGNYTDYTTYVSISDVIENSSLSTPTLSATPYKGVALNISVNPAGDGSPIPGRITFTWKEKRIPGCNKKSYSGSGSSTCSWKPPVHGWQEIRVTFTPTNTSYQSSSTKQSFFINRRTSTR